MNKELQTELITTNTELGEFLSSIQEFEVETDEEFAIAQEALVDAKGQWKALDTKKRSATDPLKKTIKEIDSWFKPAQTTLKRIESLWKGKILEARAIRAAEQERLLEAALDSEEPKEVQKALVQADEASVEMTGVQVRRVWKMEIVDESKIPRKYLIPDTKSIRAACKAEIEIPGVRWYQEESLAV